MALRRKNRGGDNEDGMSSMTDLVFLMLIFFIIMSTMANSALPVDLPSGNNLPSTPQDPPVEVGVNASSQYFFDDINTTYTTVDDILPILNAKISEQTIPSIKITGDKQASYEAIFNLIAVAKQKDWKPVLTYKK